jgi:mono/diheme cytochrome c family protein
MRTLFALILAGAGSAALADESMIMLKPGPGMEAVSNHCAACHSLDYPITNAPFLDAKGWDAEVTKMIKVFGAQIDDADAQQIKDYLTKNYGK